MPRLPAFLSRLCIAAACAAAFTPALASAASFQHRVSLKGLTVSGTEQSLVSLSVGLAASQLPDAIVGVPYSANLNQLVAVAGDAAYSGAGVTWAVISNSLPSGLHLTADGYIGGTPTSAGAGDIQVRASYKTARGEQTYQVVSIPLMVTLSSAALPAAMVGSPYSFDFKPLVSSNDPTFTVDKASFIASGLPAGLSMNSAGGLTGTPTVKNESGTNFQVTASYKGTDGQQTYTIVVNGVPLQVTQISAGSSHTCAVTTSGGVKCWGDDALGQLGDDAALANQPTPVAVSGLTSGVASLSVGNSHTCAVTTSGGVKCWGYDGYGQLGDDPSLSNQPSPVSVPGLTSGVASVSAGANHTCAVTTSGGVKCWGSDTVGQLGDGTSLTNQPTPVNVSGLTTGVASVSAGGSHTCAVTTSGGVKCWGGDTYGQLGNDAALSNQPTPVSVSGLTSGVSIVDAGGSHTCAVTTSGGAKCWGYDFYGQLGDGASLTNQPTPVSVSGLTSGVASVSAGTYHTCAVTTSGGLRCWGRDALGQLGNDTALTSQPAPVAVLGLPSGVASASAGANHTCAVTTSGGVKCWGHDSSGQLGNDDALTLQPTPVDLAP